MATLAERMEALRGERVPAYGAVCGAAEYVGGSTTDKEEREAAERAARRKAARAAAGRGGAALSTGDADKLAADILPSAVPGGAADGPVTIEGETGQVLAPAIEPQRNKGGNPAFRKGQPNPYTSGITPYRETVSHNVECTPAMDSSKVVQNQLHIVGSAFRDVPAAMSFQSKVINGRVKVSPTVRLSACWNLLDRLGIHHDAVERLEKLNQQPGAGVDLAALAGKLAQAVELQSRRASATDAATKT